MKKIVLWLMSTVTALVLLFGYHTSTSSQAAASGRSSAVAPISGGTGSTGNSSTGSAGSSSTGNGSSSAGSSSTGTGSSSTGTTGSSGSSGSSSSGSASGTVTGSVADTRWGPVQVRLTVASGKVTHVSVVEYPNGNPKDEEINAYALPILIQETLKAQSAQIDMVSGATVTSDGYLQSLQSALDKAGL